MPDTGTPLLTAADLAVLAAANLPSDVKARVLQAAAQPVPLTPADLRAIADANLPLDVMARIMTWAALSMAVASGAATCSSAAQAADHQQGDAAAEDGASHALCAADQASSEGVVKEVGAGPPDATLDDPFLDLDDTDGKLAALDAHLRDNPLVLGPDPFALATASRGLVQQHPSTAGCMPAGEQHVAASAATCPAGHNDMLPACPSVSGSTDLPGLQGPAQRSASVQPHMPTAASGDSRLRVAEGEPLDAAAAAGPAHPLHAQWDASKAPVNRTPFGSCSTAALVGRGLLLRLAFQHVRQHSHSGRLQGRTPTFAASSGLALAAGLRPQLAAYQGATSAWLNSSRQCSDAETATSCGAARVSKPLAQQHSRRKRPSGRKSAGIASKAAVPGMSQALPGKARGDVAGVRWSGRKRKQAVPEDTKECTDCRQLLPLTSFARNTKYSNDLEKRCMACKPPLAPLAAPAVPTSKAQHGNAPRGGRSKQAVQESAAADGSIATLKQCRQCGSILASSMFRRNSGSSDGLHPRCKSCAKQPDAEDEGSPPRRVKYCTQCDATLPCSMFWRDVSNPDGLYYRCKACCGVKQPNVSRSAG